MDFPVSEEGPSKKELLLDAAEELFATQGFDATTTREIAKMADVPLGLVSYYFETKGNLYEEVIARRAPEHVKDILGSMRAERQANDGKPLSPRALVHAFWKPIIEKSANRGPGWRHYIQLLVRVAGTPSNTEAYDVAFPKTYHVVSYALIDELRDMFPDADEEDHYWAFYILTSAMNRMIFDSDRIEFFSGGLCDGRDMDRVLDKVAALFEGGMGNLMSTKKRAREKAPQAS